MPSSNFLLQNYSLRGNRGDFILGVLMAEDLSTPLVSFAKILKMVRLAKCIWYTGTGVNKIGSLQSNYPSTAFTLSLSHTHSLTLNRQPSTK